MRRRTLIIVGCLELVALTLAQWQEQIGMRTDEAKYLLNIPYPHPPLIRTLMEWTEFLPFQETFWRLLLASLFVQAVWLVWDMGRHLPLDRRATLCVGWLGCCALIIQAGTEMLSPLIALYAIVFLWLRTRTDDVKKYPILVALLWTATLFTAFQGILLLPLVWSVMRKVTKSQRDTALYVGLPVILLILYTMTNPLALATMIIHRDEGFRDSVMDRIPGVVRLWIVGGGAVMSAVGTWELLRTRDRALQLTTLLILAFVTASVPYPFYAILLTPLFLAGVHEHLKVKHIHERWALPVLFVAGTTVVTFLMKPTGGGSVAAKTMEIINPSVESGTVLINGTFGHQWQYASPATVRRYKPELVSDAQAIICLNACDPMFNTTGWKMLKDVAVETWVRK